MSAGARRSTASPVTGASRCFIGCTTRGAICCCRPPYRSGKTTGTLALRSPVRPNPIASAIVELVAVNGGVVEVRGLDCLDGTPLIDIKPDRTIAGDQQ